MRTDGRHIEFSCKVCGGRAMFGYGCNLLKVPPALGEWFCAEHRPSPPEPTIQPKMTNPPAKPGQGRLL